MSSVRVVVVLGKHYLQVVKYVKRTETKNMIKVLKSFGAYSLENELKAHRFSSDHNTLVKLLNKSFLDINKKKFVESALTVFGSTLGRDLIINMVKKKNEC